VSATAAQLTQLERVLGATTRRQNPTLANLYAQIASFNAVTLRTLTGAASTHSLRELAATGIPTLFVAGEEDILFPPSLIRAVQERLPGSAFTAIPGVGHSAHFEAPEAFNAALTGWLRNIGVCPGGETRQAPRPVTSRSATDR
jgi:pimeloyl-ACP methyl ester carboxylesterase